MFLMKATQIEQSDETRRVISGISLNFVNALATFQRKYYDFFMASILKDRKYTKDHEWALAEGKKVIVGITDFAQTSLGDVTYVQLSESGKIVKRGDIIATVESVKAVSDVYAPLSGKIIRNNSEVISDPSLLNQDPYGKAWLVEVEATNESELNELMSPDAYSQHAQ